MVQSLQPELSAFRYQESASHISAEGNALLVALPRGTTLSFASKGVEAIAEDPVDGQLLFALSDYEAPGASAFVEVDVAGIADSLVVTSAVHQGKLPENVVSTGIATLEVGLRGSVTFDVTKLDRASRGV